MAWEEPAFSPPRLGDLVHYQVARLAPDNPSTIRHGARAHGCAVDRRRRNSRGEDTVRERGPRRHLSDHIPNGRLDPAASEDAASDRNPGGSRRAHPP